MRAGGKEMELRLAMGWKLASTLEILYPVSFQQACEVNTIMVFILQMKKLRLRKMVTCPGSQS